MTKHIADRIEKIIDKGGFVDNELRKLVDILVDVRGAEGINREFAEAFEHIEKTRGSITRSTKKDLFRYINRNEKYNY